MFVKFIKKTPKPESHLFFFAGQVVQVTPEKGRQYIEAGAAEAVEMLFTASAPPVEIKTAKPKKESTKKK